MKILFVNPHMKPGGISASLYNLLSELSKDKKEFQIELFLFDPYLEEKYADLQNHVKIRTNFLLRCLFTPFQQVKKDFKFTQKIIYFLLKFIEKIVGTNQIRKWIIQSSKIDGSYDSAVSFSNDIPSSHVLLGSNLFVLKAVKANNKIAWIHNDLERLGLERNYLLKEYKDFDKVVNVSRSCKKQFEERAPELKSKSRLFHNYIDFRVIREKSGRFNPFREDKHFHIVTVARIDNQQKRIDRVLQVADRLKKDGLDFRWHIVGSGPDLDSLIKEREDLGLKEQVIFEGFQANPYPFIKNADLFVLTSDYEAQGMVLSESLMLATPVVTTDFEACREFVEHELNGLIVPANTDSIYRGITELFHSPEKIQKFKTHLEEKDFSLNNIRLHKEFKELIKS